MFLPHSRHCYPTNKEVVLTPQWLLLWKKIRGGWGGGRERKETRKHPPTHFLTSLNDNQNYLFFFAVKEGRDPFSPSFVEAISWFSSFQRACLDWDPALYTFCALSVLTPSVYPNIKSIFLLAVSALVSSTLSWSLLFSCCMCYGCPSLYFVLGPFRLSKNILKKVCDKL